MIDLKSNKTRKGQYFSFDAIIASIIFIIAISILSSYWFGVRSVMDSRSENMYNEVIRVSDTLMSEGTPTNWQAQLFINIQQFGLLKNKTTYELDDMKINKLSSLLGSADYDKTRKKLNIDKYQLYITIGNSTNSWSDMGEQPTSAAANIVTTTRIAVYKSTLADPGRLATVKIVLWTENMEN